MTDFSGFPQDLFDFFEDLKLNNNRAWFNDNKARYYDSVANPISEFVVCIAPRLKQISRHYKADPRQHGGAMFTFRLQLAKEIREGHRVGHE